MRDNRIISRQSEWAISETQLGRSHCLPQDCTNTMDGRFRRISLGLTENDACAQVWHNLPRGITIWEGPVACLMFEQFLKTSVRPLHVSLYHSPRQIWNKDWFRQKTTYQYLKRVCSISVVSQLEGIQMWVFESSQNWEKPENQNLVFPDNWGPEKYQSPKEPRSLINPFPSIPTPLTKIINSPGPWSSFSSSLGGNWIPLNLAILLERKMGSNHT